MEWLTSKVLWYILLTFAGFLLMVGVGIFAFGRTRRPYPIGSYPS